MVGDPLKPSLTERIQSRKFLLAISACCYFAWFKQYASIAQVVVAYIALQAAQDALSDWNGSRSDQPQPEGE